MRVNAEPLRFCIVAIGPTGESTGWLRTALNKQVEITAVDEHTVPRTRPRRLQHKHAANPLSPLTASAEDSDDLTFL